MAIPPLNDDGVLPPGVHDATLPEIEQRFGQFQSTERRIRLFAKLADYVREVGATGLVASMIIDGSFASGKDEPSDVDLVLVLNESHDFAADLRPFEYNVLSKRRVRKRYVFDLLVARHGSQEYDEYVMFFQQVKGQLDRRKGVLRVLL